MKILYLSYDGMTDPLGQSQVIPYIVGLTHKGYTFTVLSYEKIERYDKYKDEVGKQLAEDKIVWKPFRYHKRFSLLSTSYDIFRGFIFLLYYLPAKKIRILHCRSYITSILGLIFKKVYRTKFIFDMRGFWPDERVEGGLLKKNNIYHIMKFLEKLFIKNADATISLTQNAIEEMKKWQYLSEYDREKKFHITTCCNINQFRDTYKHNIKKAFEYENIHFIYIGSIGPWHSFKEISGFIKFTYNYLPSSRFILIVSSGKEELINFIETEQFDINRFNIKTLTHNKIPAILKDTDIGFFFIPPTYAKKASSPTKMGEMLSAGIPIITGHSIGDVDELISENEIGYIVKSFDNNQYKAAIDHVTSLINKDKRKVAKRCLKVAEEYFSLEKGINRYDSIYKNIASQID